MKNNRINAAFCCILAAAAISSCGTVKKVLPSMPSLPDQAQADSLMTTLTGQSASLNIPLQFDDRPKVFGFLPDSGGVRMVTLCPEKGEWALESDVTYDCFEGDLAFKEFADSAAVRLFDGKRIISFNTIHESGDKAAKSFIVYDPDMDDFSVLSLSGRRLDDGRIEGSSNKNMLHGVEAPEIQWAIKTMESDPSLVELSESEIKTIQALEWWNGKNPNALKNAVKLNFGQIPEDCTLVGEFKNAGKEKSSKFTVAQFDIRGCSVIVAQRKATGEYILVWVEPAKYNGRVIKNFYFDNDSVLSVLYYQGRKSFKYRINLSSATLNK